ncbi:Putative protein-S-isoprenylcysteine methyltransferase [hydrothermal vent metagenome]|uniref:Protein-S-isoprenylcysteine methyltransferase n=1 Tax=hydrothermal vent metagenome TaxID=652676 RepID=A0A3B0TXB1_9ZZZZ
MSKLELKIVPPLIVAIFAMAMWGVSLITPQVAFIAGSKIFIAGFFAAAGILLMLVSAFNLYKAKTTINPMRPENASSLVVNGIYNYSRNPIYLADLLILLGWGFYLANFFALALIVLFILYVTRFQIMPEEKALENRFGDQYLAYKNRVRRWL